MTQAESDAQTKKIGNYTYKVRKLPPRVANRVFLQLMKLFGPAISAVAAKATVEQGDGLKKLFDGAAAEDSADTVEAFERAFMGVIERADAEVLEWIIDEMAKVTCLVTDKGEPELSVITVDNQFRSNFFDLYKWLVFALQVNFFSSGVPDMSRFAQKVVKAV